MVVARRLAHGRRRAQHLARRAFAPHRTILVPLLGHEESEHAVVLACRLAADRNARVVLLAPLAVEPELPLDAHFDDEERSLKDWLGRVRAYAESYGISPKTRMIRTRNFGLDIAEEARTEQASLIVVGAPIRSRQGFTGAFPEEVDRIRRHAPAPRPPDGERRNGGDAPPEVDRAPDLRIRPALLGRLCDGGGAVRADRGVAREPRSRPADRGRDR